MLHFYEGQVRKFVTQFIRVLSNFSIEQGKGKNGEVNLRQVPVVYGDMTRQVANIIKNGSENFLQSAPRIAAYISGLEYDRERMQNPYHIEKQHLKERHYDETTKQYTNKLGAGYTVQKIMPSPFRLNVTADIFSTNTDMKLQILEQILYLFNPDFEIQKSDNYIDWTSLSYIELTGSQWSSRAIPQGVDDAIDISTLQFTVPIFLSAPAKVKKLGVINKIVASIYDDQGGIAEGVIDGQILMGTRQKFTPMNFGIILLGNTVQIIDRSETTTNKVDYSPLNDPPTKIGTDDVSWAALINQYGELQSGISQLRLETGGTAEIIGTVAFHPSDPYKLLWTVQSDTIPTNSLPAITKIINPLKSAPDAGLDSNATGQRYLILNDIGSSSNTDGPDAWGNLVAGANDIIEYNGVNWQIAFDSSEEKGVQYITNTNTSLQYKWTGSEWVKSYEGEYRAGDWSIVL